MTVPDREPVPAEDPVGSTDAGLDRLFRLGDADARRVAAGIDHDAVLAAALARAGAARPATARSRLARRATSCAGLTAAAGATWWLWPAGVLVVLFVVAPALLVVAWHRQ